MTLEDDMRRVLDRVEWDIRCRGEAQPETVEMTEAEFRAFLLRAPAKTSTYSSEQWPGSLMGIPIKIVEDEDD